MRLTIIRADGAVYKDGVMVSGLDMPYIPENIHALQWEGVQGWVEFCVEGESYKPANQQITTLPDWAIQAADAWEVAYQAILARRAAGPTVTDEGLQTL